MSETKIPIQDEDMAKAQNALRRAAARARKVAQETRTPLIVYEDGRVVKKYPWKEKSRKTRKTN